MAIEKLLCIYGWPRSGTTSLADRVNRSPLYQVWIEKHLWTRRWYDDLALLSATAREAGVPSQMARTYNDRHVATRTGCTVLGDKSTWHGGLRRKQILADVAAHLSRTAAALGLAHDLVICVREPASWLASWSLTHFMFEVGPERGFWRTLVGDDRVRATFTTTLADYSHHLGTARELASSSDVRVRCLELTDGSRVGYRLDFAQFLDAAAPRIFREPGWRELLLDLKPELTEWIRRDVDGIDRARTDYERLLPLHRPYPVLHPDEGEREV